MPKPALKISYIILPALITGLGLCALGLLYANTLADFLKAAPSDSISRELKLAAVDYGQSPNAEYHAAFQPDGSGGYWLASIDGTRLRLIHADYTGKIWSDQSLELDLYRASQLEAVLQSENTLLLYYIQDGLWQTSIDLRDFSLASRRIAPGCFSIQTSAMAVYYNTPDGISYRRHDEPGAAFKVCAGSVSSWQLASDQTGNDYILATLEYSGQFDLDLYRIARESNDAVRTTLQKRSSVTMIRNVEDILIKDNILCALYLWTDRKNKLNYFTVQNINLEDGHLLGESTNRYGIYYGRFALVYSDTETADREPSVKMIMPGRTLHGPNVLLATLNGSYAFSTEALTRTRHFSRYLGWYEHDGIKVLVFTDFLFRERVINMAGNDPLLRARVERELSAAPGYLALVTILMLLLALPMTAVAWLLPFGLLGLLVLKLLEQFWPRLRGKPRTRYAIIAIALSSLTAVATTLLYRNTGLAILHPFGVAGLPAMQGLTLACGLISGLPPLLTIRREQHPGEETLAAYRKYLISYTLMLALLVFQYLATSLFFGKL